METIEIESGTQIRWRIYVRHRQRNVPLLPPQLSNYVKQKSCRSKANSQISHSANPMRTPKQTIATMDIQSYGRWYLAVDANGLASLFANKPTRLHTVLVANVIHHELWDYTSEYSNQSSASPKQMPTTTMSGCSTKSATLHPGQWVWL